ncbi:hypothetical protein BDU57DRAFT_541432 [Ampelomyces quisqualis]|uniref:Uncharacterized protein n=1 Tax=Ampelomyces quisqualis TaxID=50730 RepID=A0A6A5QHU4_AMPQU|nr:hypothetical protein BDU57DRAFT_541432 [Ampelomyces quisqualis]
MKPTTTLIPAVLLPTAAICQARDSAQEPATEAIIKAIREEVWANNQMQLAAFYENHQVACPALVPTGRTKPRGLHPKILIGIMLLLVMLFFIPWLFLLARTVSKRAEREAAMRLYRDSKDKRLGPKASGGYKSQH